MFDSMNFDFNSVDSIRLISCCSANGLGRSFAKEFAVITGKFVKGYWDEVNTLMAMRGFPPPLTRQMAGMVSLSKHDNTIHIIRHWFSNMLDFNIDKRGAYLPVHFGPLPL